MNNKENPLKARSKLATSASALVLMVALAACSSGSQSSQQSSGSSPSSLFVIVLSELRRGLHPGLPPVSARFRDRHPRSQAGPGRSDPRRHRPGRFRQGPSEVHRQARSRSGNRCGRFRRGRPHGDRYQDGGVPAQEGLRRSRSEGWRRHRLQ